MRPVNTSSVTIAALISALVLGAGAPPASASSGTLTLTQDTTLTEDHVGNVLIGTTGVALDCAGYAVKPESGGFSLVGINVLGDDVTVKNCEVAGFDTGILTSGDSSRIVGNTATGNGQGIRLAEASGGIVRWNDADRNRDWGIIVAQGSTGNIVSGNSASRNGNIGIAVNESNANIFRGNETHGNGNDGFNLLLSSLNVVIDNGASRNGRIGFEFERSGSNTVVGNRAWRNGTMSNGVGFNFNDSSRNHVAANCARRNGTFGFNVFFRSERNLFEGNRARGNLKLDALDSSSGAGNTWLGNRFRTTSGV